MPIPALTNLGFTAKEDSKYFNERPVDPTIRSEYEGGFVATRARFTRPPPREITTGWTNISESDRAIFKSFYDRLRGGAASFTYVHPTSGEILTVRFKEPPEFKYTGMGRNYRYDVPDVKLEEV